MENKNTGNGRPGDSLSRRRFLMVAALVAAFPFLARFVPVSAEEKHSKEYAAYQLEPMNGQTCSDCLHYIEGGTCAVVEGSIALNAWCALYVPRP